MCAVIFCFRARKDIRTHVGDLDVAAVPCGFGRAIGNKVCLTSIPTSSNLIMILHTFRPLGFSTSVFICSCEVANEKVIYEMCCLLTMFMTH